jgi:hypothetical protein
MPITGSQKALMYALSGVERCGATRSGYVNGRTFVSIGGSDVTDQVERGTLQVVDDAPTPKQCTMRVEGVVPSRGAEVLVTRGSKNSVDKLFAGFAIRPTFSFIARGAIGSNVTAIGYANLLKGILVSGHYLSRSATEILVALMANAPGFRTNRIATGLPVIDEITITNASLPDAITQVMDRIGGYWRADCDYSPYLEAFITNPDTTAPNDLTYSEVLLEDFEYDPDDSQRVTRTYTEGRGASVAAAAAIGATSLYVDDRTPFSAGGGVADVNTQRISYGGASLKYLPNFDTWSSQVGLSVTFQSLIWVDSIALFVGLTNGTGYTSPDGITWTSHTITVGNWGNIVWAPALGLMLACNSTRGSVFTSVDGVTWTEHTLTEANLWDAAAWSPSLGLFAIVAQSGTHRVATSPDGVTWTVRTAASASVWDNIVWADTLNLFVATLNSGGVGNNAMTSPDGITWTARAGGLSTLTLAWSSDLSLLVAAGTTGHIYTSPDGITWTVRTAASTNDWNAVAWVKDLSAFVMVASNTAGSAQQVATSTDGITWSGRTTQAGAWTALAWAEGLALLVVTGSGSLKEMSMTATTQPQLTGIPATGAGSITEAIADLAEIFLVAQDDDATAQTAVASAYTNSHYTDNGIRTAFLQDRRLSVTEAHARGLARLAFDSKGLAAARYTTRDTKTGWGRVVHVNMTDPISGASIVDDLRIQRVTITELSTDVDQFDFAPPRYAVEASSQRFSLEDLIRQNGG